MCQELEYAVKRTNGNRKAIGIITHGKHIWCLGSVSKWE